MRVVKAVRRRRLTPGQIRNFYRSAIVTGSFGMALAVGLVFPPAGIFIGSALLFGLGVASLGLTPS